MKDFMTRGSAVFKCNLEKKKATGKIIKESLVSIFCIPSFVFLLYNNPAKYIPKRLNKRKAFFVFRFFLNLNVPERKKRRINKGINSFFKGSIKAINKRE